MEKQFRKIICGKQLNRVILVCSVFRYFRFLPARDLGIKGTVAEVAGEPVASVAHQSQGEGSGLNTFQHAGESGPYNQVIDIRGVSPPLDAVDRILPYVACCRSGAVKAGIVWGYPYIPIRETYDSEETKIISSAFFNNKQVNYKMKFNFLTNSV
jgi:hypothetical protein